jgi:hypothetical protein
VQRWQVHDRVQLALGRLCERVRGRGKQPGQLRWVRRGLHGRRYVRGRPLWLSGADQAVLGGLRGHFRGSQRLRRLRRRLRRGPGMPVGTVRHVPARRRGGGRATGLSAPFENVRPTASPPPHPPNPRLACLHEGAPGYPSLVTWPMRMTGGA